MNEVTEILVYLWCATVIIYLIGWGIYSYNIRRFSLVSSLFVDQTTKICPKCGSNKLLLFSSLNKKACTDCHKEIPWNLASGQKGSYE